MNRKENREELDMMLEKLQEINKNKLAAVKKYFDSRHMFYEAAKKHNLSSYFFDMQIKNRDNLEKLIKDKNEAINQFMGITGGNK